jgi:hypothetical protein
MSAREAVCSVKKAVCYEEVAVCCEEGRFYCVGKAVYCEEKAACNVKCLNEDKRFCLDEGAVCSKDEKSLPAVKRRLFAVKGGCVL